MHIKYVIFIVIIRRSALVILQKSCEITKMHFRILLCIIYYLLTVMMFEDRSHEEHILESKPILHEISKLNEIT